ncbi:MAG TPA: extracellular solute-binding protein, partial [Bacillota bacterium]|nr:extracellular solute-binding protein [Bacillota bacterium]
MSKSCRWSICLAVIFLIGLSTYVNAAASKITLNFIGMDQAGMTVDEQKTVIREFEKLHPNIKVNATFVSYDALHDKLVTALAGGGRAFDVMLVDNTWLAELASAGWLLDVTDRVTPEMK